MRKLSLLLLGVFSLLACRKEDEVVCLTSPALLTSFAALNAAAPQVFKFPFSLDRPQTFRTTNGATISFGANAFALPNGAIATGQAELRVREIYTVPDMVLANMPTNVQGSYQALISAGEFNFQVWQGSTRLRLSLGAVTTNQPQPFTLTSPAPTSGLDTTRMLLWRQPGLPARGNLIDSSGWRLVLNPAGATTRVPATAGYYSVALPLDSLGWVNLDQYWHTYQTSPAVTIQVDVPNSATATVSRVYIRPVGFNGLGRCYYISGTSRWGTTLPSGSAVVVVVVQERAGQLYYGTQPVTTTANLVATPPLQALSATEVIQRIRQL